MTTWVDQEDPIALLPLPGADDQDGWYVDINFAWLLNEPSTTEKCLHNYYR